MEVSTNAETGETSSGRSPRFTTWLAFLIFSTVTMAASVEEKHARDASGDGSVKRIARWAVFCSSITFVITVIVVLMHLHPISSLFIAGTKIEGVLCILLVAFWAITVSIVSNSDHGLATTKPTEGNRNTIVNGNLYYFSWAGFVTAVVLFVSYLRGVFGLDVVGEIRNRGDRLALWGGMLATALVVMGSSADIFDSHCPIIEDAVFCRRTKFAIALGALGTFFSLIVVAMKLLTATNQILLEGSLALFLAIMNGFGVAFITSAKGPGSAIGNLYYFTWFSFLCAFMLTASCVDGYKANTAALNQPDNKNDNGDIQVESLDDQI